MSWIKFTLWLLGFYTIYYTAMILWDHLRSNRSIAENKKQELTFVEEHRPEKVHHEELSMEAIGSPVSFSGGVSLKQLFNLAREESVDYIKAVSF